MKKTILLIATLFWISGISSQEISKVTWQKKYAWEEGMTNAISFRSYPKKMKGTAAENGKKIRNFLITANSGKGTIKIFKTDPQTGEIGRKVFENSNFKKGKWSMTMLKYAGSNKYFLFVSYCNTGQAEIFEISRKGKIKKSTWHTETFEKGISVAVSTYDGHLFLMKPDAGWAWTFKENPDGTLGKTVWQTKNWETGMAAASTFDYNKIFTTKPNGKAWAFTVDNGQLSEIWATDGFEHGISTVAHNNSDYKQVIIGAPNKGKEWVLEFAYKKNKKKLGKIISKIIKSVKYKDKLPYMHERWSNSNWEKGATVQTLINGGKHLFVAKPSAGAAWVFEIMNP